MFLVTATEMARIDRITIDDIGVPGVVLMENAGKGATDFYRQLFPDICEKKVLIIAGSGNNGGDGFVIARHLWYLGSTSVKVICLKEVGSLKGDALTNCEIIRKLAIPLLELTGEDALPEIRKELRECDIVVDAILGTGLKSEVRGFYRQVIEAINAEGKPALAVDIPSGLDASTGRPLGVCIRAVGTSTFGLPKVGQVITPGHNYVGELKVIDIGIPRTVISEFGLKRIFFDAAEARKLLKPRQDDSHKGTYGHLLVVSGSAGKTGAAALVCQGASRVGTGLITLAIPESLNPILEVKLTEPMTMPVAETEDQTISLKALDKIVKEAKNRTAVAIGPGISLNEESQKLVRNLVAEIDRPMVIDADGVTALKGNLDILSGTSAPVVLTPHPGEMGRIIGKTSAYVQANRLQVAEEFSKNHGVVLVLKGFRTIISSPDGRTAVNSTGNPAMATGGMGDVLTGMIGGFLAQRYDPFDAACLGVYLHGQAADVVCKQKKYASVLATDLLDIIPRELFLGAVQC